MRTAPARAATLWAAVVALAVPVHAQDPARGQETDVPREFARVLLDLSAGGELLIGRVPESLPGGAALAQGARVIGSVVYRDRSRTALAVPEPVAGARERFEDRLRASGWTERPEVERSPRGFLPAYAEDRFRMFCWPATDARLTMTVRRAPAAGSYVVLQYNAPVEGQPCAALPPPSDMGMNRGIAALMPTLRLPDGASFTQPGGGSSSSGGMEAATEVHVTTELSPAQLIAHFQTQLSEEGWTAVEQVRGDGMAVQHARKTHGTGALLLWVAAYRVSAEELSLSMRIMRAR